MCIGGMKCLTSHALISGIKVRCRDTIPPAESGIGRGHAFSFRPDAFTCLVDPILPVRVTFPLTHVLNIVRPVCFNVKVVPPVLPIPVLSKKSRTLRNDELSAGIGVSVG
jgi:hypothetical protein